MPIGKLSSNTLKYHMPMEERSYDTYEASHGFRRSVAQTLKVSHAFFRKVVQYWKVSHYAKLKCHLGLRKTSLGKQQTLLSLFNFFKEVIWLLSMVSLNPLVLICIQNVLDSRSFVFFCGSLFLVSSGVWRFVGVWMSV